MAKRSATVVALRPNVETIQSGSRRFLAERDLAPRTRRVYGLTLGALADALGPDTALSDVTHEQLAGHLATRYTSAAPATFNRQVATFGSFFAWAGRQRLLTADPTDGLERRRERRTARQADTARAIPYGDLEALWGRKNVALREKVLWRLLYETAARADEVLGLNVGDLDLAERSGRIVGKGGHVERIHWATGTARLLPRYLGERVAGPIFLSERAPRIAVAKTDLDTVSGRARLSYRRAAEQFTDASGGRTLHQLRHSALTHLAEAGVDMALLKAKSRHRSLRSLERYVRPSEASVARLTANHDRARWGGR
jgi:integrase